VTSTPTNRVREIREQRGLTQVALAEAATITRQSLGAIESGRVDPSVSVALCIARALDFPVEELFGGAYPAQAVDVELVGGDALVSGARVALAFVGERWVAHPVAVGCAEAADGLMGSIKRRGQVRQAEVTPLRPLAALRDNFLVLGCAPALGLLVARLNLNSGPGHFVWLDRPSVESLDALLHAHAHAAGVHLPELEQRKKGPESRLERITLVHWETGLVVPRGNPLGIRRVGDLGRKGLRICARQPGAGSQRLLEQELMKHGLDPAQILSGALVASGHYAAAGAVALGAADVAFAMEGAALAHDLDFIAVAEERFDLVLPEDAASDPRVVRALDLMNSGSFRQELRALGGYDARDCGRIAPRKSA
jgi:molybdate-binding protein/DNA-binding XRE family transcriptional regulator